MSSEKRQHSLYRNELVTRALNSLWDGEGCKQLVGCVSRHAGCNSGLRVPPLTCLTCHELLSFFPFKLARVTVQTDR